MRRKHVLTSIALLAIAPTSAFATNGYFSHGYGIKAKGMGGVGMAYSQDAMAPATNPAGIVGLGNRFDAGVEYFSPDRSATLGGTANVSGSTGFPVPELGYARALGAGMAFGFVVYGNGGMNTDYAAPLLSMGAPNISNTYSNLMQLFVAPTFAIQMAPEHSLGISVNLAYQSFEARGLEAFAAMSPSLGTNIGADSGTGYGVRLGYQGKLTPDVTIGASYQTKTKMSKFKKYEGLFAGQGSFDIPAAMGAGLAFRIMEGTTLAADYSYIQYEGVPALANTNNAMSGGVLGSDAGPGFGWKNMSVYKVGFVQELGQTLTARAGFNYGKNPLQSTETFFNALAPATVESHVTLGASWSFMPQMELSFAFMHAFEKNVAGTGAGNGMDLKMSQNAFGMAYGWRM